MYAKKKKKVEIQRNQTTKKFGFTIHEMIDKDGKERTFVRLDRNAPKTIKVSSSSSSSSSSNRRSSRLVDPAENTAPASDKKSNMISVTNRDNSISAAARNTHMNNTLKDGDEIVGGTVLVSKGPSKGRFKSEVCRSFDEAFNFLRHVKASCLLKVS
jgi:hypothetical protein